jgi:hypothetical protein
LLEGLDDIDWGNFHYIFGPAGKTVDWQIPSLIRALASEQADICEDALKNLYQIVWHQGSTYETTFYAVPFIIELLSYDFVQDKAAILYFLVAIYDGIATTDGFVLDEPLQEAIRGSLRAGLEIYATFLETNDVRISSSAQYLLKVCSE